MNILTFLVIGIFVSAISVADEKIDWGISEKILKEKANVEKVSDGAGQGHGYSDFTEIDPVVYVDNGSADRKIEFYFYEGKLYKIFSIYRSQTNVEALYQNKLEEIEKVLGSSHRKFSDELYDIPIWHHVWETDEENLDLRYGAGYVYEVRENKKIAIEKQSKIDLKHAI